MPMAPADSPSNNHASDYTNNMTGGTNPAFNFKLEQGDQQRRQGSSFIARQVEAENMKVRQFNAQQRASEKSLNILNE